MQQPTSVRRWRVLRTPVGPIVAVARAGALAALRFAEDEPAARRLAAGLPEAVEDPEAPPLPAVAEQLAEYFDGRRRAFDLPLAAEAGTDFQRAVWAALAELPWGATASYGDVARRIGRPRSVRAVGAANGANPLPIVVPCHRVVGADGSLTGYGGGLRRKRFLLDLESGGPAAGPRPAG